MDSPPPQPGQSCALELASRPPRSAWRGRVLLTALGLLLGVLLAFQYGRGGPGSPTGALPAPQAILRALTGAPPEEKLLFATTTTPPTAPLDLLPAGAPVVYGFYEVPGVTEAGAPKSRWIKNGVIQGEIPASDITLGRNPGSGMIALRAPAGGFAPAVYEVELTFTGGKVTGSFVATWGAEAIVNQPAPKDAEVLVSNAAFAAGVGPDGKPKQPKQSFYGTDRIYFVFQYGQAEPGSAVQVKWYGGQEAIESAQREVLLPSVSGWGQAWLQAPPPGLPPGPYRAAVNMSGDTREIASGTFTVTEGATPPNKPQR